MWLLQSCLCFFFSSRRRHTRCGRDWSSDVCSSDLSVGVSSLAQETPTEREAARDVLKQIGALSQSLGVQTMVTKLSAPDKGRDEVIARVKQLMQSELLPMSDWITQHPEIGFQETQAVAKLTAYLQAHDFEVTMPVAGLATAFIAKYKRGAPGHNLGR